MARIICFIYACMIIFVGLTGVINNNPTAFIVISLGAMAWGFDAGKGKDR